MDGLMRAVLYARVSKADQTQDPESQLKPLRKYAEALGYPVSYEYVDYASGGSANRPQFQLMLKDARLRKFDIVLIWALDRFSREGINNTLSYIEKLRSNKITLKSLQESWLDTSDEGMTQLLIAIFSWVAKQERIRISERTKAGLARSSKKPGRPKGKKDSKPRKVAGYYNRWSQKKGV